MTPAELLASMPPWIVCLAQNANGLWVGHSSDARLYDAYWGSPGVHNVHVPQAFSPVIHEDWRHSKITR